MNLPIAPFPGPSALDFERTAKSVLEHMPPEFRDHLADVVLKVEEFAGPKQLAALGLEDRWELTGLYEGTPLTERSQWDTVRVPPVISLFRQPLLREMILTRVSFKDLVGHVVIHEAGHHFGFSDDNMHALEDMVSD